MNRLNYQLILTISVLVMMVTGNLSAQPLHDRVDVFIRDQMKQRRIPGMQVAIVRHGKIDFLKAYGIANVEEGVPVTKQTVFPVHSITKAFVGVAVMQLVEAGKLDLSAPVSRYLDSLPMNWQPITIRQLLTHTSGLPDIWDNAARMIDYDDSTAFEKVLQMPLLFPPGEQFKYIQTNYVIIGKLIDKLSRMAFTEFITRRQFNVVGMPLSGFGDSHTVVPHIAGSYWYFRNVHDARVATETLQTYVREWPEPVWTAVGLNTTAEELAHWSIALQQGKLLQKQSLKTLWEPGVLNDGSHKGFSDQLNGYALGWPVGLRSKHPIIGPTGGGRAAMYIYPEDDLTIIVLTNLVFSGPQRFIDDIAAFYIPGLATTK